MMMDSTPARTLHWHGGQDGEHTCAHLGATCWEDLRVGRGVRHRQREQGESDDGHPRRLGPSEGLLGKPSCLELRGPPGCPASLDYSSHSNWILHNNATCGRFSSQLKPVKLWLCRVILFASKINLHLFSPILPSPIFVELVPLLNRSLDSRSVLCVRSVFDALG